MSSMFINGAKYAVSDALAAAVAVSALSNANPAVATTATPPAEGAVIVVTSGWSEVNDRVTRALDPDATTFKLEGIDTSDTGRFPAGEGIGAYRVASTFTPIDQVRDITKEGGDQNYFNWRYVEDTDNRQRSRPTFKNATVFNFLMDYDAAKPWYARLQEADREQVPVVLREILPNGQGVVYYYGYPSFDDIPTKTIDENITVTLSLALVSAPIRLPATQP